MAHIELFTPSGVISGLTPVMPLVDDGPDLSQPLPLEQVRWYPIDGTPPVQRAGLSVPPDDILVAVIPEPEVLVHANWYDVALEVGPYRVMGRFGTSPGFDPERALTRPSGSFVPLRDAVIELREQADAGQAERTYVQVNRFAVESVAAPLMLGFFFPGASLTAAVAAPVA